MVKLDNTRIDELAKEAKSGDREAFSEIVRIMMNPIVALTYKMTQDPDNARDMAQETFVSAWQNLKDFKGDAKFTTWMYRIATNKCLNFIKRNGKTVSISSGHEAPTKDNPEERFRQKELREKMLRFTAVLPAEQRAVFELRFYKELSIQEVATITGKAEGTVKSLYREAIIKLRQTSQQQEWQ